MDMNQYTAELQKMVTELDNRGANASIAGDGAAQFVVVDLGQRGAELYRGNKGWIIDPADKEELLGEVQVDTMQDALDATWRWLKDAVRPITR